MSTAVKEAPAVLDTPNWRQPEVFIGQDVVWFADGDKSLTPSCAKVVYVSARSVELRVEGRDQSFKRVDVRHVNDPALRQNDELKKFGGWDYPVQYRQLLERIRALEDAMTRSGK